MKINIIILMSLFLFSCDKEFDNYPNPDIMKVDSLDFSRITDFLPGYHLIDMELDTGGIFYFVTSEMDWSNYNPVSSYIPSIYFLTKYDYQNHSIEVLDSNFLETRDVLFDNYNNMWIRGYRTIHKREGNTLIETFRCEDDLIQCFDIDSKNNIWAGGLNPGLIKISNDLIVTVYDMDNSPIQTNGITDIHVDKYDNIWVCLWSYKGVLKLENKNWINYYVSSQNLWCITIDKDDFVWVGTGHDNPLESLKKFDGTKWITLCPKDEKGNIIEGTVRTIVADREKIWVVSETTENMAFKSNVLLTFDGLSWRKIETVPEDDGISDIVIDYYRNVAWIRMLNEGIFKVDL